MQTRGKRILSTAALAILSLCIAFAIPEVLLRLLEPSFVRNVFGEAGDHLQGIDLLVSETERYQAEHGIEQPPNFLEPSDLLWSLVPGYDEEITRLPAIDSEDPTYRVKVNALGFRGDPPTEREDVLRVLCLGDSVTFGDKLDEEDTYPRVLEEVLRSRLPGVDVEVINAGVPGYSSLQGLALWEKLRQYNPSVVVVGLGINDAWSSRVRDSESLAVDGSLLDRAISALRRTHFYQALRALLLRARSGADGESGDPAPALGQRVPPRETDRNIRRIVREARAQGALPIVANFVFGDGRMEAAIQEAAQKDVAPYIDAPAMFRRAREQREAEIARTLGLSGRCPDTGGAKMGRVFRVRLRDEQATGGEVVALVRGVAEGGEKIVPLNDSGEGCDERAGDGIHSGLLATGEARRVTFKFAQRTADGGIEDEFHGFPIVWRKAIAGKDLGGGPAVGPIRDYNEFYLMSEEIHPNAEGARLIAEGVADIIVNNLGRRNGSGR